MLYEYVSNNEKKAYTMQEMQTGKLIVEEKCLIQIGYKYIIYTETFCVFPITFNHNEPAWLIRFYIQFMLGYRQKFLCLHKSNISVELNDLKATCNKKSCRCCFFFVFTASYDERTIYNIS